MSAYRSIIKRTPEGHDSDAKMSAPAGKNDDACVSMMIANAVAHYCPGSGSEVRSDPVQAASGNHNEWSNDEWDQYENWSKKFKSKMMASQRRR